MPQLQPVPPLRKQAMLRLARSVAFAIQFCIKQGKKNAITGKKTGKKKNKQEAQIPSLFIAEKELLRMRLYLRNARPRQSQQDLFQEVLREFTRMHTWQLKVENNGKLDKKFLERVQSFEKGLGDALDLFLESDIKVLNFVHVQHLIMNWVDSCRLSNKDPKAESLLNHGQVEKAMLKMLGERATKLDKIEEFVWPHLVSGELLRLVGGHCSSLQTLILSCECQVAGRDEDESTFTVISATGSWEDDIIKGLESLFKRPPGNYGFSPSQTATGCPKLKKLVLPHLEDEKGTAVAVMANALTVLSHLEYVCGIPMLSILMKFKSKNQQQHKLQLKNICDHDLYMRRPQPNENYLKSLLPKLDTIDIIASPQITKKLSETFPFITTLKVDWPDFENHTKLFTNLQYLDLILDYRSVWQLLRNIGKHCKKIKSITLRQPTIVVSSDHEEGAPPPKIPSLETLHLSRSSFIEFTAFKNLIVGAPNLKKLYITLSNDRNYIVDEFDDRLIRSVSPYLSQLESFTVECLYRFNLCMHLNCILTLDTVKELISKCKNISYIGHLDSWDVDDKTVDEFIQSVKKNNMRVQIQ